jgi:hypothetical protein
MIRAMSRRRPFLAVALLASALLPSPVAHAQRRPAAKVMPAAPPPAPAGTFSRWVGGAQIVADPRYAWPGGLMIVRLRGRTAGTGLAILEGQRAPFVWTDSGSRALVPVPLHAQPGPAVLGVEMIRRTRVRIPLGVAISSRTYGQATAVVPEEKRALLTVPARHHDSRMLLVALRTLTPKQRWSGPFRAPVAGEPADVFGAQMTYEGAAPVERYTDSIWGEYHRGLDYPAPEGTEVHAPAPGTVVLAGPLVVTGNTVVVDHGQGVVSVFYHLAQARVTVGQILEAGNVVGTAGATGIAATPHVHWGTYVNGAPVDPRVFLSGVE